MIGLDALYDFLEIVLWTGRVKGERPVSAILIAPPGHGKTSLLEHIQCPQAPMLSDLTAREIHTKLEEAPLATHLLLGDMLSIFGHKAHVVRLTLRSVSAMTGETLKQDPFSGKEINRQLGLITAIPPDDLESRAIKREVSAGGFASRFLMIRYSYKPGTVVKIHDYIRKDEYITKRKKREIDIAEDSRMVQIAEPMSQEIQDLASRIKKDSDGIGTRVHHHLRTLIKASARRGNRTVAKAEDLETVLQYVDFFMAGKEL